MMTQSGHWWADRANSYEVVDARRKFTLMARAVIAS